MSTTVTVVIPAYNACQYLNDTIKSVLAQTFKNFEVIIIDDGSTDNTADIARQYSQKDNRIKIILQKNQGVSVARNKGIQVAQGKVLAFLDSDDQWLPDKLEIQLQHINSQPELGISFGQVEFISPEGYSNGQFSNSYLTDLTPVHLYYENLVITPSNALLRRAVFEEIGYFDINLKGTEDAELFLRAICNGWKVEGNVFPQLLLNNFLDSGSNPLIRRTAAPIEAMACGLPVVAADAPGVPDILEGGEASGGLIVPRGDATALALALCRVLDDQAWGHELGKRARCRAEDWFSFEVIGRQLRDFLFSQKALLSES